MQLRAIFGVGLLSVLALAIAARQTQDTPEGCVRAFLDALAARDFNKAMGLIADRKPLPATYLFLERKPQTGSESALSRIGTPLPGYQLRSSKTYGEGDDAVVTAEIGLADNSSLTIHDVFHLTRADGHWRIIPLSITNQSPPPSIMAAILAMTATPQNNPPAASSAICLSNVKQLGLAGLMYSNDYDDRFPPSDRWKSVEMPYVKNQSIFHCPDDKRPGAVSYRMSDFLSRTLMTKIAEPAATVLDYEGESGYLVPRHTVRGSVAYTDGHAKLVTPEAFREGYHKP